jgi:protein-S-isoprenylcysteine O-methyltransferase Ste14
VGGILYFLLIVLLILASFQVDKLFMFSQLLPTPWNMVVSVPILATGLFLTLWSLVHFFKVRGTPVPFNPPPSLVTIGPYAHVRNPMITGDFILLFGIGILFKSISLTLIFTPLFVLLNVLELKAIEEPELEKRLGKRYVEYRKRVPMFVPRLKGKAENGAAG